MSLAQPFAMAIADSSQISTVRIAVARMSETLAFDATRAGRAAIVVTEAVTNILKHAGTGTLAARPICRDGALGIELLAIDSGPGMRDFAASAADGHSTAGTSGTGLGAMRRQSDEFEVYTRQGEGTILRAMVWASRVPAADDAYEVGAICVPKSGEDVCGDAWGMTLDPRGATFLLADGLGHGPDANRAAAFAVDVLARNSGAAPTRILELAHARLRPTRGAAVAVIRHDAVARELSFAGVGNVAACVIDGDSRRAMVSHNGIVGHNLNKSQMFSYVWPRGSLLVAHTDGVETHWDLGVFPGLLQGHPAVVAAMLFREHARGRDDVGIVVARTRH